MSLSVEKNNNFITIYTDASVRPHIKRTQVAWKGRCSFGLIEGIKILEFDRCVAKAEMHAIYYAIEDAVKKYPSLEGLFINSDNLECVQAFWTFRNQVPHKNLRKVHCDILALAAGRWIRTKHVKAHTGGQDIRSYMNRTVDRLTRTN